MFPSTYQWLAVTDGIRAMLGQPLFAGMLMFAIAVELVPEVVNMLRGSTEPDGERLETDFFRAGDGYEYERVGSGTYKKRKDGSFYEVGVRYRRREEWDATRYDDDDEEWVR